MEHMPKISGQGPIICDSYAISEPPELHYLFAPHPNARPNDYISFASGGSFQMVFGGFFIPPKGVPAPRQRCRRSPTEEAVPGPLCPHHKS